MGRPDRADGPGQADEERAPRGQVSQAIVPDGDELWVITRPRLMPGSQQAVGNEQWAAVTERYPGRPGAVQGQMKQLHNVR